MGYLEVKIAPGCALSANNVSLANKIGCLASLFRGPDYPELSGYVDGLEREGWTLVSSRTNSFVGMIDGLPFRNDNETLIFRGNGRFEVEWNEDQTRWHFKGYQDEDNY